MTQALYRRYRPQTFKEVKGQEHVVRTLTGALEKDQVAHAYLFSGPRGTGKTTIARVFAKALNCEKHNSGKSRQTEPCNKCETCNAINDGRSMDIIEIDGASNRGIDEIRNIKEIARVSASRNKYKIFIIDEVHSLTKDAFNGLLKILEEPPSHVKFMLATTEPHKLLPTVLSRVQRFDLRKLSNEHITEKLKEIGNKEKVGIEEEVLRLLSSASDGSLRDAEANLSKLISLCGKKITLDNAKEILGFIPFDFYPRFLDSVSGKNKEEGIKLINEIYESGIDLENFNRGFLDFSRKIMVAKANYDLSKTFKGELTADQTDKIKNYAQELETKDILKIIKTFTEAGKEIKISPIPQLPLELAVMQICAT